MLLPGFILLLIVQPSTREVTAGVLADAFIQVSAFVAATLALYYGVLHSVGQDRIAQWMQKHPFLELSVCALLVALPGCGGAIIVITQYTQGKISFGAVVAVLTATMGDAAFLLLAQQPLDGLLLICSILVTGIVSGWLVNLIHAPNFMRPAMSQAEIKTCVSKTDSPVQKVVANASLQFWRVLLLPALALGAIAAFQLDANLIFGLPDNSVEKLGAILGFVAVLLWSLSSIGDTYETVTSEDRAEAPQHWMVKVAQDTQFVTSWVVAAFLMFELTVFWFDIDPVALFQSLGPSVVLMAVLVGLLPGCGPQILVTGLYLQQAIPFSAQLANAISNDGDALFPAIALAPKAALIATLYSAIPALVVGYGFLILFE